MSAVIEDIVALPFTFLRLPNIKLKKPSWFALPGRMTVFAAVFLSYVLVMSGLVYDIIVEPPATGMEKDPQTGSVKPVAILKYRVNGQYIIEGLSAGMMFAVGAVGFFLLDKATKPSVTGNKIIFGVGVLLVAVAYMLCQLFIRIKIPGYMVAE